MAALSPAAARYRARIAALSRAREAGNPDRDTQMAAARRGLAEAKIADYIERVLDAAPPLTDEQRTRLAELLKPVRQGVA